MERIKLKLNILLEISTTTKGPEADKVLDVIEKNCKANELFIVDWQRQGDKIRIYSIFISFGCIPGYGRNKLRQYAGSGYPLVLLPD